MDSSGGGSAQPLDRVDGRTEAVTVRFWARARAAAGTPEVVLEIAAPTSLDVLVDQVTKDRDELRRVLEVCSVLVNDRPSGAGARGGVVVRPGDTVDFLPPFAGG